MIAHIFFTTIFLTSQHFCKDIVVSKLKGADVATCGLLTSPCKTINYAVSVATNNSYLRVLLVAGFVLRKHNTYELNKTICVERNIILRTLSSSRGRAVITTEQKDIRYLFHILERRSTFRIEVHSITIVNLGLVHFNSSGNVLVKYCSILSVPYPIFYYSNKRETRSVHLIISVINSYAYDLKALVQATHFKNISLLMNNTKVIGNVMNRQFSQSGILLFERKNEIDTTIKVRMLNCRFRNLFESIQILGSVSKRGLYTKEIDIVDCYVKNNGINSNQDHAIPPSQVIVSGFFEVFIFGTQFIGNKAQRGGALTLRHWKSAVIKNCVFSRNIAKFLGGACDFKHHYKPRLTLTACLFEDNAVAPLSTTGLQTYGGAINSRARMEIMHSVFLDNYAMYGGSIFSSFMPKWFIRIPGVSVLAMVNVSLYYRKLKSSAIGTLIYSKSSMYMQSVQMNLNHSLNRHPFFYYYGRSAPRIRSNVTFSCPINNQLSYERRILNKAAAKFLIYRCLSCERGTYSLEFSYERWIGSERRPQKSFLKSIKCLKCPAGGTCDKGLVSNDNLWGHRDKDKNVHFSRCPSHYCCSRQGTKCVSFNTCRKNRTGILCGTCKKGFSENLIGIGCVQNNDCSERWFWIVFIMCVVVYTLFFMYLKEMATLFFKLFTETSILHTLKEKRLPNRGTSNSDAETLLENIELTEFPQTELRRPKSLPSRSTINYQSKLQARILAVTKTLFFFYQIEFLIHVDGTSRKTYAQDFFKSILSSMFNFKFTFRDRHESFKLCPIPNMNAVGKETIKVMFLCCIFVFLAVLYVTWLIINKYFRKQTHLSHEPEGDNDNSGALVKSQHDEFVSRVPFDISLGCVFVQMLLHGYIPLSSYCFQMLKCVSINQEKRLFIDANVTCYTWWQYGIGIFTTIWIIPQFCVLYVGSYLLQTYKIALCQFLKSMLCPPLLIYYYARYKYHKEAPVITLHGAIASKHVLQVFNEPFVKPAHKSKFSWEAVMMFRRLLLVVVSVFSTDAIMRLNILFVALLLFLIHHSYAQPYEEKMLNLMETLSLALLCVLTTVNMFWAYTFAVLSPYTINKLEDFFLISECVIMFLPVTIIFVFLCYIVIRKFMMLCRRCF